jgi:soluble lytic murein transglycosylase-like protein
MSKYERLYQKTGKATGINPVLLQAIALKSTQEDPGAIVCYGHRYYYGLMLLSDYGANLTGFRGNPEQLLDPERNIGFASLYLKYLLQQYNYDLKKGLVAYLKGRYDSRYSLEAEKIIVLWKRLSS